MDQQLSPKDIVSSGLCIGCGSCVARTAPPEAQMRFDRYGELKPHGALAWYRNKSETLEQICPFSPGAKNENYLAATIFPDAEHMDPVIGRFQSAYVGHVAESEYRLHGSSGGLVTWVASELLRLGMIDGVAHVVASPDPDTEGRFFKFRISRTESEIREGAKSRYYPVEMSQVLKEIRETPGRYAVVGIPCFIKAVQLLRLENPLFRERICFTLGLFCGHMKSARFVESFAWQMNVPVSDVLKVDYRHKDPTRPANLYTARLSMRNGETPMRDWWHLADGDWGAGFFMNSACNFCDDVIAETADISFGDAWVEPYSSDGKGTNVVVTRSKIIDDMISRANSENRLHLDPVDNKFIEQTQAAGFRQRREGLAYKLSWLHPDVKPIKRVSPDSKTPAKQRKLIYRMRYGISKWSHRFFLLARRLNQPQIYLFWARSVLAIYHGVAYHQGKLSEIKKRFAQLRQ